MSIQVKHDKRSLSKNGKNPNSSTSVREKSNNGKSYSTKTYESVTLKSTCLVRQTKL